MGCLIVALIPDKKGIYRRVEKSEFGENPASEFLCALGNLDAVEALCETICGEPLLLSSFVPKKWACTDFGFMLKELPCF